MYSPALNYCSNNATQVVPPLVALKVTLVHDCGIESRKRKRHVKGSHVPPIAIALSSCLRGMNDC